MSASGKFLIFMWVIMTMRPYGDSVLSHMLPEYLFHCAQVLFSALICKSLFELKPD